MTTTNTTYNRITLFKSLHLQTDEEQGQRFDRYLEILKNDPESGYDPLRPAPENIKDTLHHMAHEEDTVALETLRSILDIEVYGTIVAFISDRRSTYFKPLPKEHPDFNAVLNQILVPVHTNTAYEDIHFWIDTSDSNVYCSLKNEGRLEEKYTFRLFKPIEVPDRDSIEYEYTDQWDELDLDRFLELLDDIKTDRYQDYHRKKDNYNHAISNYTIPLGNHIIPLLNISPDRGLTCTNKP